MKYDDIIEAMAIAEYNQPLHFKKSPWEKATGDTRKIFRDGAERQLQALLSILPSSGWNLYKKLMNLKRNN